MTVGFLGLIVSPMSFHVKWLQDLFANSSISVAMSSGLAEGLLIFATLVVCADTLARDAVGSIKGWKQFSLICSGVILFMTIIVMTAAHDHMKQGTLNGEGHGIQLLLFSAAIFASVVSVLSENRNKYVGP